MIRLPRLTAPHPVVSVSAVTGAGVGMWPTPLPRGGLLAGVVVGCCVAVATIIGLFLTRTSRPVAPRIGWGTMAVVTGTVTVGAVAAQLWQNLIRSQLGLPQVGIDWFAALLIPWAIVFSALVWAPRLTALSATLVAALAAGYLPASGVANAATVPTGIIYAELTDEPETVRAERLVSEWLADGTGSAVVIAVPTGSGWVDQNAVTGIEERFDGDADVLAMQYAAMTSWQAFISDRDSAGRSAIRVVSAVADAVAAMPQAQRPDVYLYGQSLGAIGADTAHAWARDAHPGLIRGSLLAGPPGGTLRPHPAVDPTRRVIVNPSDPVAIWSPSLLWQPPAADTPDTVGSSVATPPWLPGLTFLQTSVDLLGAISGPAGIGHRYGTEQGILIPGR